MPPIDARAATAPREWEAQDSEVRLVLDFADLRGLDQSEEHDLLASHGADVMVQAAHFDAGNLLDHRLHERPSGFEQMGPDLLEQVPPLLGRKRLDQMLFGGCQDALEPHYDQIIDQVRADILGPAAHVLQLEATHALADRGFDLALRFHGGLQRVRCRRHEATPRSAPQCDQARLARTRAMAGSSYKGTRKNSLAIFVSRRTMKGVREPGET